MELTELQEIINRHGRNLKQEIGLALSEQEAKDIVKAAVSEVFSLHVVSTRSFNELEMLAEDLECVKMWLDDKKAPKTDSDGNVYSVIGRIQCLLNVC